MDPTLGVRILFAIIVGTLVSFNSLAVDSGVDSHFSVTRPSCRRHRHNAGGLQPALPRRVQDRVRDGDGVAAAAPRDAESLLRR